jgi:tripartite-type tricarboxylate transporter receptor subunit TctC
MGSSLGQGVVVENVTGADGVIGVGRVARAQPDGYTLSVGQLGSHVLNGAVYSLPYDLLKDFEPISLLSSNPYILITKKDVPANNLTELIDWSG